jgi:hypothetical protein
VSFLILPIFFSAGGILGEYPVSIHQDLEEAPMSSLKERSSMKVKTILVPLVMVLLASFDTGATAESRVDSNPVASILLLPTSTTFVIDEVPNGAVGFTALVKNEGAAPLTIAHPSICFPAEYKQGETRGFEESHGKSEILLKIRKPDGTTVVLRDGHLYYFDPGNIPLLTISPQATKTFHVGWFFQNARGRWERDDEAARVFLLKGEYAISIAFRNLFPKAALYDEATKGVKCIDVWTGEMESAEIIIEVK